MAQLCADRYSAYSTMLIDLQASRYEGTAPLAVFFDASATVSGSVTDPFLDLLYTWSFGDTAGGATWSYGARTGMSKNVAYGPVAAHVFETAGSYTVTVSVYDGYITKQATVNIVVTAANTTYSGTTLVVAHDGDFTGAPSGTQLSSTNLDTIMNTTANHGAAYKRIRFKKGGTYTTTTGIVIDQSGEGLIDAWGSGADPIWKPSSEISTGRQTLLEFSNRNTPSFNGWTISGIEFDGSALNPATTNTSHMDVNGTMKKILIHNCYFHEFAGGGFSTPILDNWNNNANPTYHGHTIHDQIFIVGTRIANQVHAGNGIYMEATRLALLGSSITNCSNVEHCVRSAYVDKGVYACNTISTCATTKHLLKQHAGGWTGTGLTNGLYSQKLVVADNQFTMGPLGAWAVSIQPQDTSSDERLRKIIVERNKVNGVGAETQICMVVSGVSIRVRNNIAIMTGALNHDCILVDTRGVEPTATDVWVMNNSGYSGSTGDFQVNSLGQTNSVNLTVTKNNVGYAPNANSGTRATIDVVAATNTTGASGTFGNSSNGQLTATSPYTDTTPADPQSGEFNPANYAVGSGVEVSVWDDFLCARRGRGNTIRTLDAGAVQTSTP